MYINMYRHRALLYTSIPCFCQCSWATKLFNGKFFAHCDSVNTLILRQKHVWFTSVYKSRKSMHDITTLRLSSSSKCISHLSHTITPHKYVNEVKLLTTNKTTTDSHVSALSSCLFIKAKIAGKSDLILDVVLLFHITIRP